MPGVSAAFAHAAADALVGALAAARRREEPFVHFLLERVFPDQLARELRTLPFAPAGTDGLSGKRELHNDTRRYFDKAACARLPVCAAVACAFQSDEVAAAVERLTGARQTGSYVRLEYAQDVDGFWLQPHTDLGVKTFTLLIYLADDGQEGLGTDLYRSPGSWACRTAFEHNTAIAFAPGDDTWHGLEKRPITGVRKSLIMNYVTDDWRERSQLSFPDQPVLA